MSKRNPTCGCGEEGICNDVPLDCHPCCRCVPQRLCATLPSYDSVMMELAGNGEYTGTISCGAETMDLQVVIHHENGTCYWRVVSEEFYIDEWFEIDGTEGRTCEKPILEIESPFHECPGTITIQKQLSVPVLTVFDEIDCPQPIWECCECLPRYLCLSVAVPCFSRGPGSHTCHGVALLEFDEELKAWRGTFEAWGPFSPFPCFADPVDVEIRPVGTGYGECDVLSVTFSGGFAAEPFETDISVSGGGLDIHINWSDVEVVEGGLSDGTAMELLCGECPEAGRDCCGEAFEEFGEDGEDVVLLAVFDTGFYSPELELELVFNPQTFQWEHETEDEELLKFGCNGDNNWTLGWVGIGGSGASIASCESLVWLVSGLSMPNSIPTDDGTADVVITVKEEES